MKYTVKPTVGFIGLGNMGKFMAQNLLKAGYTVVVNDMSEAPMKQLESLGAKTAGTPKEVAATSSTIVTMLPSNPHVQQVYAGNNGIFSSVRPKTLLIDASTIDPNVARDVYKQAKTYNSEFLDAPVSGGVGGAEKGTLTFMVGGDKSSFENAKPYLAAMGKNIVHCGASGSGQIVKLCNNLLLAISMIGTSEVMNLGTTMGMDAKLLASIINSSSGRCWSSDTYNPFPGVMENVPSSRNYEGGFGSKLMLKDVGLALDAAKSVGAPTPLGDLAKHYYSMISADSELGNKDFSVILKFLQNNTGKKN